jgi:hypothetical protein
MKSVFYMHGMDDWTKMVDGSKKINSKCISPMWHLILKGRTFMTRGIIFLLEMHKAKQEGCWLIALLNTPGIRIALSVVLLIFLLLGSL